MKLDHVTYQVPVGHLADPSLDEFFKLLEMQELKPDQEIEKGWNVRWFRDADGFQIHLVEPGVDSPVGQTLAIDLQLGHFCAILNRHAYKVATESIYVERNSKDSPRAWLRHAGTGLRVEIRPKALDMDEAEPIPPSAAGAAEGIRIIAGVVEWPELPRFQGASPPTEAMMINVFNEALRIFKERNKEHRDSWRQEGWRGCVSNVRRKAVRAWDNLWHVDKDAAANADDLYDVINYCAFTIICAWEQNRDGDWHY